MATPGVPPDLQQDIDDFKSGKLKQVRLTRNASDDDIKQTQRLWRARAALAAIKRDRMDVLAQIGTPDVRAMLQRGQGSCGGAHNFNGACSECGFSYCTGGCGEWIANTCGWGVRCTKPGCAPTNIAPKPRPAAPVVVPPPAAPVVVVVPPPAAPVVVAPPAAPPAVVVVPPPAAPPKPGKKAGGKAKRTKKRGGWGAPPSSSSDESDSQSSGLWQPIPPKGGKKKVPSAPPAAAKKKKQCKGVHEPTDICEECGQNFCKDCKTVRKGPFDATKNYSCGCGGGAPAVDLTAEEDKVDIPPVGYPKEWGCPPPGVNPYTDRTVRLDPSGQEYRDVAQRFRESNLLGQHMFALAEANGKITEADYIDVQFKKAATDYKLVGVYAIRSLGQWIMYNGFKMKLAAKNGVEPSEVEEIVYHGTDRKTAFEKLTTRGFNRDKTVQNKFGDGAYFDVYGPISQYHAFVGSSGGTRTQGTIVVSHIASGKLAQTRPGNTEPPAGYDCGASGSHRTAWMRVSFHDAQVCPVYILVIERTTAKP